MPDRVALRLHDDALPPCAATLFDVTTEPQVDPTHITLQTIEMLRLMFVLQGLRRRPDLEAVMDWLNKGRVLVYEKAAPDEHPGPSPRGLPSRLPLTR